MPGNPRFKEGPKVHRKFSPIIQYTHSPRGLKVMAPNHLTLSSPKGGTLFGHSQRFTWVLCPKRNGQRGQGMGLKREMGQWRVTERIKKEKESEQERKLFQEE